MCSLKWHSLGPRFVWRFVAFMGTYLLVIGAVSFGLGLKLMEYAEQPDLTPVIAGLPTLIAGILGLFGRLGKRKWTITCFTIACVISGVLSVHMVYRFIAKEINNLALYDRRCRSEQEDSLYHCDLHAGTIVLSIVSILMIPIAPVGLVIHVAAKRILQDKDCYIIWCHSEKNIQPLQEVITAPPPRKHYLRRKAAQPAGRYALTSSLDDSEKSLDSEKSNLRKDELDYLPIIPNFKDLAKGDLKDNFEYAASKTYSEATSPKKTSLEKERDFLDTVKVDHDDVAASQNDPDPPKDDSTPIDVGYITGNDLYLYKSQEELRSGYLDQTVAKRGRATGVSDESDIERKSSLVDEAALPDGTINLGYSTLTRSPDLAQADVLPYNEYDIERQSLEYTDDTSINSDSVNLQEDNEDRGMSEETVGNPKTSAEGSPLRTRRGVSLTLNCNGVSKFPRSSYDVAGTIDELSSSTSKGVSCAHSIYEPALSNEEQLLQIAESNSDVHKRDENLDNNLRLLQKSITPSQSDIALSELWTPDHVTPKGRLSFLGLDSQSPSREDDENHRDPLCNNDKPIQVTSSLQDQSCTRRQSTCDDNTNAPRYDSCEGHDSTCDGNTNAPRYDSCEGHDYLPSGVDGGMFLDHAKLWRQASAEKTESIRQNMTRDELEELLPYIM